MEWALGVMAKGCGFLLPCDENVLKLVTVAHSVDILKTIKLYALNG